MRLRSRVRAMGGLGLFLAFLSAGCTISVQPWTKTPPALPTGFPPTTDAPPGFPPNPSLLGTNGPRPPYGMQGASSEQMVKLISQAQEAEQSQRVLRLQVEELQRKLNERNQAVEKASYEVESTTRQVERTRQDLGRWRSEMDDLQNRIKKLEDSRNGLKTLIEAVLRELEYDRELRKPALNPLLLKDRQSSPDR